MVGLSLDFQLLNMVGFAAYAIYNAALYWNPTLRAQYALQHGGSYPAIHSNDVFFALHASAATLVTLFQCFTHDRGDQRLSRYSIAFVVVAVGIAVAFAGVLLHVPQSSCIENCDPNSLLSWMGLLYYLSYIKLVVSIIKYMPQVSACGVACEVHWVWERGCCGFGRRGQVQWACWGLGKRRRCVGPNYPACGV